MRPKIPQSHSGEGPPFLVPAAVDDAGLTVYQFRALAHVARRAGEDDGLYYGSGTKSAAICGMSIRQWKYALKELIKLGYVEIAEQAIGRRTKYRYRGYRGTGCTSAGGAPETGAPGAGDRGTSCTPPGHQVHTYKKESPTRSPLKGSPSVTPVTALVVIPKPPKSWSAEACDDWTARFEGTAPGGRIGKALGPLVKRLSWEVVRPAWQRYLAEKDAEYATPQDFATKPGPWLNGESPRAQADPKADAARAWVRRG